MANKLLLLLFWKIQSTLIDEYVQLVNQRIYTDTMGPHPEYPMGPHPEYPVCSLLGGAIQGQTRH